MRLLPVGAEGGGRAGAGAGAIGKEGEQREEGQAEGPAGAQEQFGRSWRCGRWLREGCAWPSCRRGDEWNMVFAAVSYWYVRRLPIDSAGAAGDRRRRPSDGHGCQCVHLKTDLKINWHCYLYELVATYVVLPLDLALFDCLGDCDLPARLPATISRSQDPNLVSGGIPADSRKRKRAESNSRAKASG